MNIKNIVKGWGRWATNGTRPDWANERGEICKSCEHNEHDFCQLCGCYCPVKTMVKEEECHANKWPKITN